MIDFFEHLQYWHWGILAAIFLTLEMFATGAFFLFTGVGALVVLIILLLIPTLSWPVQFMIWGILSVGFLAAWKIWRKKNPPPTHNSTLNKRGHQYINRTFTLENPVENGFGKIKVDDSIWKVECEQDFPAGTKIKITGVDGVLLKAEKASTPDSPNESDNAEQE